MVYTHHISNFKTGSQAQVGISPLFTQYDLVRIAVQEDDFLPYELVRKDRSLYLHMIRPVLGGIPHLDIFEMGGRMGEENVYGYLAVRKNQDSATAYLLLSKPADFGSRLLGQFRYALKRILFFDKAIFR